MMIAHFFYNLVGLSTFSAPPRNIPILTAS